MRMSRSALGVGAVRLEATGLEFARDVTAAAVNHARSSGDVHCKNILVDHR